MSVAELVKMDPTLKAPSLPRFFSYAQRHGDGCARKQLQLIFMVAVFLLWAWGITAANQEWHQCSGLSKASALLSPLHPFPRPLLPADSVPGSFWRSTEGDSSEDYSPWPTCHTGPWQPKDPKTMNQLHQFTFTILPPNCRAMPAGLEQYSSLQLNIINHIILAAQMYCYWG